MIEASYRPGFIADLTFWRACVFDDQTIGQMIRWCAPNKRRCYELYSETMDAVAFAQIIDLALRIDFDVLQPHEDEHLAWTDFSSIELYVAQAERGITLAPYLGYYGERDLRSEDLQWCSPFRDAWFALRAALPRDLNPYRMEDEEPSVEPRSVLPSPLGSRSGDLIT